VKKFVIAGGSLLFILDYSWYADHVLEIDTWSSDTFGYQPRLGLTLDFKTNQEMLIFILRWG